MPRKLELRHGEGMFALTIPDGAPLLEHGIRQDFPAAADATGALRVALDALKTGDFARVAPGHHLTLLIDDATRSEPHLAELAACLELAAAVKPSAVTIFVCTGTHDGRMADNVELLRELGAGIAASPFPAARLVMHDCRAPTVDRGRTRRGTRILVNAESESADLFLAVSDMKNHYFAGYSNPVKGLLPGICAFETARGNHALALDPKATFGAHPWHPDPARRDNPLAADMVEASTAILRGRPAFALCLFTRSKQEVLWAQAGPMSEVAGRGMQFVDQATSVTVTPSRRVVVTAGGHPLDESLYTAQRALELTRNAVLPGGEILFFAACRNGIGPPEAIRSFYDRLKPPLDLVLQSFQGEYEMYSHKTYKFARMLKEVRSIRCVTDLDRATLEAVHLQKEEDPQGVLERWFADAPTEPVLVFHDASKLAVYADRREPVAAGR